MCTDKTKHNNIASHDARILIHPCPTLIQCMPMIIWTPAPNRADSLSVSYSRLLFLVPCSCPNPATHHLYIEWYVSSDVTMGVRKRIIGDVACHGCTKPIHGKGKRVKSLGVDACMHSNCAVHYWHKMFIDLGKALPLIDLQVHADIVADYLHTLEAYD